MNQWLIKKQDQKPVNYNGFLITDRISVMKGKKLEQQKINIINKNVKQINTPEQIKQIYYRKKSQLIQQKSKNDLDKQTDNDYQLGSKRENILNKLFQQDNQINNITKELELDQEKVLNFGRQKYLDTVQKRIRINTLSKTPKIKYSQQHKLNPVKSCKNPPIFGDLNQIILQNQKTLNIYKKKSHRKEKIQNVDNCTFKPQTLTEIKLTRSHQQFFAETNIYNYNYII